jgi:hypothetical protein
MSTIKELEEAQQGYLAAKLAVEKTKPDIIEIKITYEIRDATSVDGKRIVDAGKVSYNPENGIIRIYEKASGGDGYSVDFNPIAIPALMQVLRELTE